MIKFIAYVALVALCIVVSIYGLKSMGWIDVIPSFLVEILALLSLATIYIFYKLQKIPKSDPDQFTKSYLTSIVFKLLVGSALVFTMVLWDKVSAFENASLFMVSYLVFTGLEVAFLWDQKNKN